MAGLGVHAEFAATVELVVEIIFFNYLKAALLEPAFFPVMRPPCHAWAVTYLLTGPLTGFVDLVEGFPSR